MIEKLQGLVAATHTPFDTDGRLNLAVVERQAAFLQHKGVSAAFIGGTTGESHSLTLEERLDLAGEWAAVAKGSSLKVIMHVGSNCLDDSRTLAGQAQKLGAAAIAAVAPSYFKPRMLETLVESCRIVAAAAPEIPFYYYDIPAFTGITLSMPDFLDAAVDRIPTLAGIKFSNPDMMALQRCLKSQEGRFDILWGIDEWLLAALALGCQGGVGSSYCFAAAVYLRLIDAFHKGNLPAAREEQYKSVRIIRLLSDFGYMAAAKAVMGMLGVPVGPPRLPNASLAPGQDIELRTRLEKLGFFDWI
jgi:N-acetylneuraminate lyase